MLFSLFARKHLRTRADGKLEKWQAEIQTLKHPTPTKKIKFLRSYQKEGVSKLLWLHQLGCHGLLADEMGLGKADTALALIASSPKVNLPDLVTFARRLWYPFGEQEVTTHFPGIKVEVLKQGK